MAGGVRVSPSFAKMTEEHRLKIKSGNLLNILQEHAEGTREMSATQIQAANILLKKCMPDLQAVQHTGESGGPVKIQIGWIKD